MNDSVGAGSAVTASWPQKYKARFWSRSFLPYRVAAVQFAVAILKSRLRIVAGIGILAGAVAIGAGIGALIDFSSGWPFFSLIPLLIVVISAVSAILSAPRQTQIYDRYRAGTESRIMIADRVLVLSLNGHLIKVPVKEVLKVWKFGDLSAIEIADTRSIVLPTAFVPHRNDATKGPEIYARWGKPVA